MVAGQSCIAGPSVCLPSFCPWRFCRPALLQPREHKRHRSTHTAADRCGRVYQLYSYPCQEFLQSIVRESRAASKAFSCFQRPGLACFLPILAPTRMYPWYCLLSEDTWYDLA